MWPLECKQEFPKIWPGDLVFDQTWHIFELGLDIVETNILTKFHKNVSQMWSLECKHDMLTDNGRRTTDDGQPLTTIAHHFVHRWAKNDFVEKNVARKFGFVYFLFWPI